MSDEETYVQCPSCTAILKINKDKAGNINAEEIQWWELLDWKTMPDVFSKLPTNIRFKIEMRQGKIKEA